MCRVSGVAALVLLLLSLTAAPVATAGDAGAAGGVAPLSRLASVRVVGSGPIAWGSVAVHSAPRRGAPVLTTLAQFRPDYRPRTVMALDEVRDAQCRVLAACSRTTGRPSQARHQRQILVP